MEALEQNLKHTVTGCDEGESQRCYYVKRGRVVELGWHGDPVKSNRANRTCARLLRVHRDPAGPREVCVGGREVRG